MCDFVKQKDASLRVCILLFLPARAQLQRGQFLLYGLSVIEWIPALPPWRMLHKVNLVREIRRHTLLPPATLPNRPGYTPQKFPCCNTPVLIVSDSPPCSKNVQSWHYIHVTSCQPAIKQHRSAVFDWHRL